MSAQDVRRLGRQAYALCKQHFLTYSYAIHPLGHTEGRTAYIAQLTTANFKEQLYICGTASQGVTFQFTVQDGSTKSYAFHKNGEVKYSGGGLLTPVREARRIRSAINEIERFMPLAPLPVIYEQSGRVRALFLYRVDGWPIVYLPPGDPMPEEVQSLCPEKFWADIQSGKAKLLDEESVQDGFWELVLPPSSAIQSSNLDLVKGKLLITLWHRQGSEPIQLVHTSSDKAPLLSPLSDKLRSSGKDASFNIVTHLQIIEEVKKILTA